MGLCNQTAVGFESKDDNVRPKKHLKITSSQSRTFCSEFRCIDYRRDVMMTPILHGNWTFCFITT